jgi:hypothetical protein
VECGDATKTGSFLNLPILPNDVKPLRRRSLGILLTLELQLQIAFFAFEAAKPAPYLMCWKFRGWRPCLDGGSASLRSSLSRRKFRPNPIARKQLNVGQATANEQSATLRQPRQSAAPRESFCDLGCARRSRQLQTRSGRARVAGVEVLRNPGAARVGY